MALSAPIVAAIGRLKSFYNGLAYNAATNPGGMGNGGNRRNFEPALKDLADVATAVTTDAEASRADAAASKTAAATSAAAAQASATQAQTTAETTAATLTAISAAHRAAAETAAAEAAVSATEAAEAAIRSESAAAAVTDVLAEGPVVSVNNQQGIVTLSAVDVGAAPAGHGHTIGDVSGLSEALAGKASTASASSEAAGLMPSTDKAKLDGATASATAGKLALRDQNGKLAGDVLGNAATATALASGSDDRSKLDKAASRAWLIKAAAYTASAGEKIAANTATVSWVLKLPAAPGDGTTVDIMDAGGAFATNNLTVDRNGQTIMGLAENMMIDVNNVTLALVFTGATWRLA